MEKEVIRIKLTDRNVSLLCSKIGGPFIWPDDDPPGAFLAQINLSDLAHVHELPATGWLQFFIDNDPDYGLFNKKAKVVYRPTLLGRKRESNYEYTPVIKEGRMRFSYGKEDISWQDHRYDKELTDETISKYDGSGHKLLGYPCFCQNDPRYKGAETERYDTLLFQLDSDYEFVVWGDSGVANFFVNSEDLKRRDFSDVLFYWDCC